MASPSARSLTSFALVLVHFLLSCNAFTPQLTTSFRVATPSVSSRLASSPTDETSFIDTLTNGYQLFQKSKSDGYDFKQSVTIAIAGEYDAAEIQSKIKEDIASAPVVMFTWEPSPDCKKAIKYLDIAGASYKIVRLDDPWDEGNPVRAELGKMVGRSSVPCIFIGGQYVGGFDGGVGDDSPGILEMAFKGTLGDKLREVGAMK